MFRIVVLWYIFIFLLSLFYTGDLNPLSFNTKILLFLFIIGLSIGGFMASLQFRNYNNINPPINFNEKLDKPNYFISFLVLYYSVLFLLLIKFILVNGSDILVYVRAFVFSSDYQSNPFFISDLHVFIHRILIIPSILSLFIIGLKNHFYFFKNKILYISIFLLLIDSIIMFGRLNLYYMGFMYISTSFIISRNNSFLIFFFKKFKTKNIFKFFIALSIIFIISSLRSLDNTSTVLLESFNSFIQYNIYGFRIFDINLNDPYSIIHEHSYGRSFLGQIDSVFSIFYRLTFDANFLPANSLNGSFLNTYFDVGNKEVITANAFGTLFFTLYRDFGIYGILFSSLFFGFILNWFSLKFKYLNNPKDLCIGLLLVYALVFSVYQSVFEGVFWPMFFIILGSMYFNKLNFKIK